MKMGFKASVLASSFLVGVAFVVPAYAQQAPAAASAAAAEPEEAEETIVVTGTRLRRERLDNPNPTVQVGAEELEDRQIANVGDAIEDVPLLGFGSNARGTQTQNGDSAIFPDVLDLGTNRTLTLLNGRRLQPSLPATNFVPGNNTGAQVDLTTINPALISRVEIVAGTGGAIYGADAVGGVVNLITRTDYEGGLLTITGGMTELGDGAQARVTGLYGQDYFEGRGNAVISLDYFQQDAIFASAETAARYGGSLITNPFDGSVRNPATFSAASAADALRAGTALPTPFLPAASDGFSSTFLGPLNIASRLVSPNGVLLTRWAPVAGLAAGNPLVPSVPVSPFAANSAADPQGFAFFAPTALPAGVNALTVINTIAPGTNLTGLTTAQQTALAVQLLQRNRPTPIEWWRNNRSVNPLLLVGTFGTFPGINLASGLAANPAGGYFPTVTNTDPATALLFPRLAVPLQFNAAGDLVEFKLGSLTPENPGLWGSGYGSDGYDSTAEGHSQVQAGTERVSFGVLNSVEVTDNLRVRQEVLYNRLTYSQISAAPSNTPSGSAAAGSFAVPVYLDQNPFVSAQALSTVANLQTRGFVTPLTNGQRTMFIGRTLTDLFGGGLTSTADISTFRFMNAFEGQFRVFDRQFYWDVTGIYGKSETIATQQDVNDIAFALAIDPVRDSANNIVCRQQTLAAPESITVRNPGITSGLTTTSLIPTAAEVAACRPLNLLGNRPLSADDAARILTEQRTDSENVQTVASFSLSGELWQLPAGPLQLGIQAERREERSKYLVNDTLRFGRGRNATQGDNIGARQFLEYGYEANLPVFGPDFNFIGARKLEFAYAWRFVERTQSTAFSDTTGFEAGDDTFNISGSYAPINGLTFRAAQARTVRSPSIIEMFDPGLRAFGGLSAQSHPCATVNIDSGPAPATRRANCIAAVKLYGIAATDAAATTFLASFAPATAPNRPATAAGNPFLANEEGNTKTFGVTIEPSFIPGLVLAVDYFDVELTGELGLTGTPTTTNACFDSAAFPNSIVGSANPACDAFLFAQPSGGNNIVPLVNPLTGRTTILNNAYGGQVASPNQPFEIAAIDFLNLNLNRRILQSWNYEIRYAFDLGDVPFAGSVMEDWGRLFLRGTAYRLDTYQIFNPSLNDEFGEHTRPEWKTRLDVRHQVGAFEHTLQWFWNDRTVTNIQLTTPIADQSLAFVSPSFSYFNYNANYQINDNLTLRLVVNNLTDTQEPRGVFGVGNDFDGGVGREYLLSVSSRF